MSDLDKAIRDAAQNANWFGLHAALTAVLNLHEHAVADGYWHRDGTPALRCLGCDEVITHKSNLCPTRREIRREVGVSSQDTPPAPRPAREWREGDPEPDPRPCVVTTPDGHERIYAEDWGGWVLRNEIGGDVEQWDELPKPVTEVPSPSTQTGGHQ